MKKKTTALIVTVIILSVLVFAIFHLRNVSYSEGEELGYLLGYNLGYTDALHNKEQDSQLLAGEIVPYEYGNSKWKGFIMAFPEGYDNGQNSVTD